jgi:hypothetical protein
MIQSCAANQSILDYLKADRGGVPSEAPDMVDTWSLGTHPDLVEYLWQTLTAKLPRACAWVAHRAPVLVHPDSGIIFGYAQGTGTLALRLPDPERDAAFAVAGYGKAMRYDFAISPAEILYAKDLGPAWAFVHAFMEPAAETWCLRAYQHAGQ